MATKQEPQQTPRERKFDWELARDLYYDGCNFADVGRFFNVSRPAIVFAVKSLEYQETGIWTGPPSMDPGRVVRTYPTVGGRRA